MSMMARFVAITPDQLAAIKDTPEMVEGMFASDAGSLFGKPLDLIERLRRHAPQLVADTLERLPPEMRAQLQQRLGLGEVGHLSNSGVANAELSQLPHQTAAQRRAAPAPGTPGHSISIDKAWHGLHYLLCGAPEPVAGPLGQAVFGGTDIGEDQGYGPARYFTPTQVAEIRRSPVTGRGTTAARALRCRGDDAAGDLSGRLGNRRPRLADRGVPHRARFLHRGEPSQASRRYRHRMTSSRLGFPAEPDLAGGLHRLSR